MFVLVLALGCSPIEGDSADSGGIEPQDSGTDTTGATYADPTFVGTAPSEPLGLPEFTVSNQYGLMRSADYLEGSPVALWFFTTGWTDC